MTHIANFDALGKTELRAACKQAGISYGKLTVGGMRDELRKLSDIRQVSADPQYVVADPATMTYDEVTNALCPSCGVHLSNGLLCPNDESLTTDGAFATSSGRTLYETGELNFEYECMGCGHQFGKESAPYVAPVAADRHSGTGLKIEKDREERNGIKRPSAGGRCRAIWDALDAYVADPENEGELPTSAIVKAIATEEGWNPNNASIEFYQWRKFNGITGRSK